MKKGGFPIFDVGVDPTICAGSFHASILTSGELYATLSVVCSQKCLCCQPKHWTISSQHKQMEMYSKIIITHQLNKLHILIAAYISVDVHLFSLCLHFNFNLPSQSLSLSLITAKTTVKDQLIFISFPEKRNIKDHPIFSLLFTHILCTCGCFFLINFSFFNFLLI